MLAKPVMGPVTSPYGWRGSGRSRNFHNGIDWGWLFLHPIKSRRVSSPAGGVVIESGWSDVAGNYILIQVTSTLRVRLIHLKSIAVGAGDRVWIGRFLGVMGATGSSTSSWMVHLHLDVYVLVNGVWRRVDPAPYITLPYPGEHSFAGEGALIIVDDQEEDDMDLQKPTAFERSDGKEWMIGAPWLVGNDEKQHGYIVTTNKRRGKAWMRMFAKGIGSNRVDRNEEGGYIDIQEAYRDLRDMWLAVAPEAAVQAGADMSEVLAKIGGVPTATVQAIKTAL